VKAIRGRQSRTQNACREYPIALARDARARVSVCPKLRCHAFGRAILVMRFRSFVFVAFFSSALSGSALAQPSASGRTTGFDGDWQVTMTCPNNTEKSAARGYKRQFPAQVKNGVLQGEIGVADSAGWLRIEGRSAPTATPGSRRSGRTGEPDYAAQHPPPSSPYAYRHRRPLRGRARAAAGASSSASATSSSSAAERRQDTTW
jgi:hypothetical protein